MFGPWAPNGYLLASIPPLGDIHVWALGSERLSARVDSASRQYIYIFIYFYPLAPHVWALGSERLFARVDSTSRRDIYIYFYPLARHVWALGLKRLSCVESIIRLCGLAPSRQYSFGLAALLALSR